MIESLFARVSFSPNDSQHQAIEHLDGSLFLVAGPGSGKTRVVFWRVVNIIAFHGVAPESIFLSTFTEKAAKQLQGGLVSLLGFASEQMGKPYDLSGMYVGMVHALCHRLLQDRSLVVDCERSTAPAVLDELGQYFTLAQGSFWFAAKARLGKGRLNALPKMLLDVLRERRFPRIRQVIIIENSKQLPGDGALAGANVVLFTGNDQGRRGFIPQVWSAS